VSGPLVTIVTPSYNQGQFIRATIESVLSQDYPHIEYIIMDAGSTDETQAVAAGYAGRLQWISEKDRGQSHAINKGFRLAKGEIVSWLNSDDVILPGAVSRAVRCFERNPRLGAVYGEGYRIDAAGKIKSRFMATEPFNLWKLIHVVDYILQQTSYFRKDILDRVGYLDEALHWSMDWDLFIRIGERYEIEYIPEYMGSIREYETAKSFAGGGKRFRELVSLMRRHSGVRYPPAYFCYGLDTYSSLCCDWLQRWTPALFDRPSRLVRGGLRGAADCAIRYIWRHAQGWYPDGWVGPKLNYMLGPGSGTVLMQGVVPDHGIADHQQELQISCNGQNLKSIKLPTGEFRLAFDVPPGIAANACTFVVKATRSFLPRQHTRSIDLRRLSYILKSFGWT
jgi:glycosyltransferase involved in cell wall biosynthesis